MKQCDHGQGCGHATWKVSNPVGYVRYSCGQHLGEMCAAVTLWVRPTHARAIVDVLF